MAEDQVTSGDIENPEEQQMELSLRPQTLDQYLGQKRVKKEMSISYSDYEAGDGKLKSVYLSFDTKEDDDTFYLTYKSGPDGED